MNNYRHNKNIQQTGGFCQIVRYTMRILAIVIFCMVLGTNTVSKAYVETPGVVVVESAKIRSTPDTSGAVLASVKKNATVSICDEVTGNDGKVWYQVFVDANTKGYIRSDLVQKSGSNSNANTNDSSTVTASPEATTSTTTTPPETQVTAVDRKTGTVVTNNVRIRKGASTAHGVVATANRGMVVTVTGEATAPDGKPWYQVSFSYNNKEITGFIRADLVTFEEIPADSAVSEITGTTGEGETEEGTEPVTEEGTEAEEPATEEQPEDTQASTDNSAKNIILLNVDETPYVLPGFKQIILKWEEQDINAWKNGEFYIFYAQKQNGDEGWYLYDSTNGVYQRYVYDTESATIPKESLLSGNLLPVIVLVIIVVALLAVIGLMFLKLREYTSDSYEEYDDEEDEEEYFGEDELEDEDDYSEDYPVRDRRRQPAPRRTEQAPVRRPQGQAPVRRPDGSEERPVRRPTGQEPVRRPQGQEPVRRPDGSEERPVRRPTGQEPARRTGGQQSERRLQGEAPVKRRVDENGRPVRPKQPEGEAPVRRQPQSKQSRPVQNVQQSKTYKSKNFLAADEDEDMEFIDI